MSVTTTTSSWLALQCIYKAVLKQKRSVELIQYKPGYYQIWAQDLTTDEDLNPTVVDLYEGGSHIITGQPCI